MHHKFAVFGNGSFSEDGSLPEMDFHTVFTGSYNWTANATKSLENGVFLQGSEVVNAYCQEYVQILLLSRTIEQEWWEKAYDWTPDLRIGT